MLTDYKYEIAGAFLKFFGLFYFIMGIFTTYSWGCKELDFQSPRDEISNFWNPIASVSGCVNTANFLLIIFSIYKSQKHRQSSKDLENKILFFILYVPLYFVTITYKIIEMVKNFQKDSNESISLFMSIGELFLFVGSFLINVNITFYLWSFQGKFNKTMWRFVVLIAFIGMLNYFIFHLVAQQIFSFIRIASDYKAYSPFYNKTVLEKYSDPLYFLSIRIYMLPLVTLFCCTSTVFLIKYIISKPDHQEEPQHLCLAELSENEDRVEEDIQVVGVTSAENNSKNKEDTEIFGTFRLPPLSLLLGIFVIIISVLIISIYHSMTKYKSLYIYAQYLSSIFPIPFYLWSLFLLSMQIVEMEKWSILKENNNLVDTSLVWIGAIGQLINAFSKIEIEQFSKTYGLSIIKGFLNGILILQTMMQTMTLSLALNRKWNKQSRKSWHECICPPVGLVCINFSFLMFNIYMVMTNTTTKEFHMNNENRLFLKIFGTGFHSIGESLSILQGLHLTLVFVKLIVFTIN